MLLNLSMNYSTYAQIRDQNLEFIRVDGVLKIATIQIIIEKSF